MTDRKEDISLAKPPVNPLKTNSGREMGYFEKLAQMTSEYLQEENIALNFKGYKDTIAEYASLEEQDKEKAWRLAKEINAWSEYFAGISNLIQKLALDAETDKIEIQSMVSIESDGVKVANGDRLSNKDHRVVYARKKRNSLKSFYDAIESEIKFLERAYYHCKATYDWANKPSPVN